MVHRCLCTLGLLSFPPIYTGAEFSLVCSSRLVSLRCVYPYSTTSHWAFLTVQWRVFSRSYVPYSSFSDSILNGSFVFVCRKGKILVIGNVFCLHRGSIFFQGLSIYFYFRSLLLIKPNMEWSSPLCPLLILQWLLHNMCILGVLFST